MSDDEYGWQVLDRIAGDLRSRYPELVVRPALANGHSSTELVARSRDHLAVVVGRRGSGGFVRMLIGSTAFRVATDAGVPVVVVPEDWKPGTDADAPVVIGVDYRDVQPAALRFAFEEAARRGVRVVAVHGRDVPAIGWEGSPITDQELASAIAPVRAEFPDVQVDELTSDSHPLTALLEEAPRAQMLVVGRHGKRGGGLPFGSVARAALHYAEIPLVVVPTVTDVR
jgi:nucleotide-binding universal stress UspA family protein